MIHNTSYEILIMYFTKFRIERKAILIFMVLVVNHHHVQSHNHKLASNLHFTTGLWIQCGQLNTTGLIVLLCDIDYLIFYLFTVYFTKISCGWDSSSALAVI